MTEQSDFTRRLQKANGSKIVLVVGDGLGGRPLESDRKSESQFAEDLSMSMPLIPLRVVLNHAAENNYGMAAFNVKNMEQIQAIIEASRDVDSLGVVQASRGAYPVEVHEDDSNGLPTKGPNPFNKLASRLVRMTALCGRQSFGISTQSNRGACKPPTKRHALSQRMVH